MQNLNYKTEAILFDNVQFIYELQLAKLELQNLNINHEITNDLKKIKIQLDTLHPSNEKIEHAKKRVSYFKKINNELTHYFYITQKNQTRSSNQYLTHWFYPYKGKFHPQMIRALLNIANIKENETILDTFSGSGTTLLEAQILNINSIGIDISPLCVIQSKVKTESIYEIKEIKELKNEIINFITNQFSPSLNKSSPDKTNNLYYTYLDKLTKNEKVKNFYILAKLIALSDYTRRKKFFLDSFSKNVNKMILSLENFNEIKQILNLNLANTKIENSDSRKINLPDNSIDGIITSPPYSIALDYIKNDNHALQELECNPYEIKNNFIGIRGKEKEKIKLYYEDMMQCYKEMYRVLKQNKYAVIIIGNATYQGKEIKIVEFTIDYMQKIGFELYQNIDKIIFGLYNVMKKENILIFKKV